MGNWRTVHLIGTCDAAEVATLRTALTPDDTWSNFGPLSITEGLCGLGDWPAEQINAHGNLAERNYTVADVAEHLTRLLEIAPSLRLVVHCGDDWESSTCIAGIRVQGGQVTRGAPEVKAVLGVDEATATGRLLGHLVRPRSTWVPGDPVYPPDTLRSCPQCGTAWDAPVDDCCPECGASVPPTAAEAVPSAEGHQFHFSVTVQGEGADWVGEPFRVTVRAWSLSAACTKAAAIPLAGWTHPVEEEVR